MSPAVREAEEESASYAPEYTPYAPLPPRTVTVPATPPSETTDAALLSYPERCTAREYTPAASPDAVTVMLPDRPSAVTEELDV